MNLQIDYLRTFIEVADTKGFTRAGIQVNRSQSAVSVQIKRLENEIGKPLFERIGKKAKLTAEGNILIKYARQIVKEHDDAVLALSKPWLQGFIRFGSPEHYTSGVLPNLLARFASSYPDVLVEMRCENSDKIKEAKAGITYRIVYVSRSISGLLDAVRAGLAIAPVVQSNVPSDLKIVGIENRLPVLPVSNIILHKAKKPLSETIACFANHLIKSLREKS